MSIASQHQFKDKPQPQETRTELAAAHRLAKLFGMTDLIHTHISSRVPDQNDRFLITPYGCWFHEVTTENLSEVDADGKIVDGSDVALNPAGFIIHEAVYSARPDINAVFHTHTPSGVAVASLAAGVRPLTQYSLRFHNQIAYHDFRGATLVEGEREALQGAVSDPNVRILVLRNHGMVTLGCSIPEAFMNMYFLDKACQVQMLCENSQEEMIFPPEDVCNLTARQFAGSEEEDMQEKLALEWNALLRLIDNQDYR